MDAATAILTLAFTVLSTGGLIAASCVQRKIDKRCNELLQQIRESHGHD